MTGTQQRPDEGSGKPRKRGIRGVALTEFALILPLMIMLVLATIDLGLFAQTRLIISSVCREGGSIASREISVDATLTGMLAASGKPLNLAGPDGRVYITRINAGTANSPNPTIKSRASTGGLGASSKIQTNATNMGLTPAVYNHLVYKAANDAPDIPELTVVEVFYKYHPITLISNIIPDFMTRDGGGMIIWSKAVF